MKSISDLINETNTVEVSDLIEEKENIEKPFSFYEYGFSIFFSAGYAIALALFIGTLNWLSKFIQLSYKESLLAEGMNILTIALTVLCFHITCGLIADIMTVLETKGKSYEYENPYFATDTYDKINDLNNITNPICKARFDYYLQSKRIYYFVSIFICAGVYIVKMYP